MEKTISLYQGKVKLAVDLDEGRHSCKKEDGTRPDSVTSFTGIIKDQFALNGLMKWAVGTMGLFLAQHFLGKKLEQADIEEAQKKWREAKKEAADIGTEIHKWVADWIAGKKPEIPQDERVKNGVIAFMDFQKKHKVKWLESERIVYSKKHDYWGILDAVGRLNGKGDLILFDFKSSNGLYPEYAFQAAAYQLAYTEETKKKIAYRMVIGFGKETGEFQIKEYRDNKQDEKAFLACLTIKRALSQLK